MGILIDFQEAKEKMLNSKSVDTTTTPQDLKEAVEKFAYSQIPKWDRIAMTLAGLFNDGTAEEYLDVANELALYIASDFMIPYKSLENNESE